MFILPFENKECYANSIMKILTSIGSAETLLKDYQKPVVILPVLQ